MTANREAQAQPSNPAMGAPSGEIKPANGFRRAIDATKRVFHATADRLGRGRSTDTVTTGDSGRAGTRPVMGRRLVGSALAFEATAVLLAPASPAAASQNVEQTDRGGIIVTVPANEEDISPTGMYVEKNQEFDLEWVGGTATVSHWYPQHGPAGWWPKDPALAENLKQYKIPGFENANVGEALIYVDGSILEYETIDASGTPRSGTYTAPEDGYVGVYKNEKKGDVDDNIGGWVFLAREHPTPK